jgi:hypothetical protein
MAIINIRVTFFQKQFQIKFGTLIASSYFDFAAFGVVSYSAAEHA